MIGLLALWLCGIDLRMVVGIQRGLKLLWTTSEFFIPSSGVAVGTVSKGAGKISILK